MKVFSGTPVNLDKTLLAKVIKSPEKRLLPWKAYTTVYVAEIMPAKLPKADAYIFSEIVDRSIHSVKSPIVLGVHRNIIADLNEGDIVMIEKTGSVNVLYEIASPHNVIHATNRCNLNCMMCPQPSKADEDGMLNNNLSLIRMISPERTKTLAISGGEPTLINA
jgi:sulfatase maturation enzyme AslB (radical SAM superfamily)